MAGRHLYSHLWQRRHPWVVCQRAETRQWGHLIYPGWQELVAGNLQGRCLGWAVCLRLAGRTLVGGSSPVADSSLAGGTLRGVAGRWGRAVRWVGGILVGGSSLGGDNTLEGGSSPVEGSPLVGAARGGRLGLWGVEFGLRPAQQEGSARLCQPVVWGAWGCRQRVVGEWVVCCQPWKGLVYVNGWHW